MTEQLYRMQIDLLQRALIDLGRRQHLPLRDIDTGYMVHCFITGAFGSQAPKPFLVLPSERRWVTVQGYTRTSAHELKKLAQAAADPEIYDGIDWGSFVSVPMPTRWREGQQFAFEVVACPMERLSKPGPMHHERPDGKGPELDAFLARCTRKPDGHHDREEVYKDWLEKQVSGFKIARVDMVGFQRVKCARRNHPKESFHVLERPRVTYRGILSVTDSDAFSQVLARGLGRHRAFGFGMIRLRNV